MKEKTWHARRRDFLKGAAAALTASQFAPSSLFAQPPSVKDSGFRPLFDGKTLNGWTRKPRSEKDTAVGRWTVEDGVIVGGQDPVGTGSYLVSDETFADFELQVEARPDWPADTGIYVRALAAGHTGFQVNLDYRPHGSLGGYYGNGLGSFHAYAYGFTAEKDSSGKIVKLIPGKPQQPNDVGHLVTPDFAAPAEVLLKAWKLNDWNQYRIRSVGAIPTITTWINGVKISELNSAKMVTPGWEPDKFVDLAGRSGHIAFEVHNNYSTDWLGSDRWGPGALCRWRNVAIKTL